MSQLFGLRLRFWGSFIVHVSSIRENAVVVLVKYPQYKGLFGIATLNEKSAVLRMLGEPVYTRDVASAFVAKLGVWRKDEASLQRKSRLD